MPSIRESLQEMGVSAEQVLSKLAQMSTADTNHKAVPTPLTNYLDVRHLMRHKTALYKYIFIYTGCFLSLTMLF